jgi:hypothetical protein
VLADLSVAYRNPERPGNGDMRKWLLPDRGHYHGPPPIKLWKLEKFPKKKLVTKQFVLHVRIKEPPRNSGHVSITIDGVVSDERLGLKRKAYLKDSLQICGNHAPDESTFEQISTETLDRLKMVATTLRWYRVVNAIGDEAKERNRKDALSVFLNSKRELKMMHKFGTGNSSERIYLLRESGEITDGQIRCLFRHGCSAGEDCKFGHTPFERGLLKKNKRKKKTEKAHEKDVQQGGSGVGQKRSRKWDDSDPEVSEDPDKNQMDGKRRRGVRD